MNDPQKSGIKNQNFLVFGAGAIGTYIGGSLALTGQRVVFVERPEAADELRRRGLRLNLNGQEQSLPGPQVRASLDEALALGPFDAAIFALKSFDTQAALEVMRPFAAQMPPILCLQNGVENEAAIAAVLGPERVIAGTVTSAVGRRAIGDIVLERLRGMGVAAQAFPGAVGNPTGGEPAAGIQPILEAARLNCKLYPQAADMKWSKLLTNLVGNATAAILNLTPAEVFGHPGLYQLEIAQLREALAVMQAQEIQVVDLPATPVRMLALGARLPLSLSRPLMARAVGGGRGAKMPSFHIDLYAGRGQSEVDWLNGAIVRAGERLNLPTPANRLLNETLLALTRGDLPKDAFARQPKKLLDRFLHP